MFVIYPQLMSGRTELRVGLLFLAFLFPMLWALGQWTEYKKVNTLTRLVTIGIGGTVAAWLFYLLELKGYHLETNYTGSFGFFGDEFKRSLLIILPTLIIGETIFLILKNRSRWWLIGLTVLIFMPTLIGLRNFAAIDAEIVQYPSVAPSSPDKPNIVFILADDLGYNDISLHGNALIQTPHIDGIAKSGVDFTRAYASASVCAPSRAGMLTGQYQQEYGFEFLPDPFEFLPRTRVEDFELFGNEANFKAWYEPTAPIRERGLDPMVNTIADYLKEEQYSTTAIGKWHMGFHPRNGALYYGFDEFYGIVGAASLYAPIGQENIVESRHPWDFADLATWQNCRYYIQQDELISIPTDSVYMTDAFTEKAVEYIEKNKDNRFFLHLSYTAPHGPFQAQQKYYDQFAHIKDHNKRVYYAMIKNMDDGIGRVKTKLAKEGLLENTIIVFASDNGGATYTRATDNSPFFGGKMSDFQGGIIVPAMMQWTGKIPAGTPYEKSVSLLDITPTILQAIQHPKASENYAGTNLLPYLQDSTLINQTPHEALYWRTGYVKAIVKDSFKLHIIEKEGYRGLFDIKNDIGESNNLVEQYPEKAAELEADWEVWSKQMPAPKWESNASVAIPVGIEEGSKEYFFPW